MRVKKTWIKPVTGQHQSVFVRFYPHEQLLAKPIRRILSLCGMSRCKVETNSEKDSANLVLAVFDALAKLSYWKNGIMFACSCDVMCYCFLLLIISFCSEYFLCSLKWDGTQMVIFGFKLNHDVDGTRSTLAWEREVEFGHQFGAPMDPQLVFPISHPFMKPSAEFFYKNSLWRQWMKCLGVYRSSFFSGGIFRTQRVAFQ